MQKPHGSLRSRAFLERPVRRKRSDDAGQFTAGCRAPGLARREADAYNRSKPAPLGTVGETMVRAPTLKKGVTGAFFHQKGRPPRAANSYRAARRNTAKAMRKELRRDQA